MVASQGLSHVTAVSAATNDTVYLNNPTTGLVVDSNVEIGENLTVEGDLEFNGNLTMNTITVQTLFTLDHVVSQGNTTSNTAQFTNPTTSLTTTGNVEVGGELSVSGNTSVSQELTVSGNVGIGTTAPVNKLHVLHDSATQPNYYNASYYTASLAVINELNYNVEDVAAPASHYTNLLLSSDHAYDSGNNAAGAVSFAAPNEFGGYSVQYGRISGVRLGNFYGGLSFATMHNLNDGRLREDMRIQNGHVGIGTTSPATKLHVEHYGSAIGDFEGIRIANHATNLHATSRPAYEFVVSDINSGTGIGHGKFAIGYRGTTSASRTDRLVIDNSGNVGVGVTDPGGYKLNVNGSILGTTIRGTQLNINGVGYMVSGNGNIAANTGVDTGVSLYAGNSGGSIYLMISGQNNSGSQTGTWAYIVRRYHSTTNTWTNSSSTVTQLAAMNGMTSPNPGNPTLYRNSSTGRLDFKFPNAAANYKFTAYVI